MSGRATLGAWVARLREASAGQAAADMAQGLVPVVRGELASAQAQQRSPDGLPWTPTKDGKPAMQGWANQTSVDAIGTVLRIRFVGHIVYHLFGTHRTPARPLIPSGSARGKLGNAIRRGLIEMGPAWFTRRGRGSFQGKLAKPVAK